MAYILSSIKNILFPQHKSIDLIETSFKSTTKDLEDQVHLLQEEIQNHLKMVETDTADFINKFVIEFTCDVTVMRVLATCDNREHVYQACLMLIAGKHKRLTGKIDNNYDLNKYKNKTIPEEIPPIRIEQILIIHSLIERWAHQTLTTEEMIREIQSFSQILDCTQKSDTTLASV